jgi:hypothetical protein
MEPRSAARFDAHHVVVRIRRAVSVDGFSREREEQLDQFSAGRRRA